ncbi:5-bromo-4-chloroindolyl phosphate hydrolysis family protein [Clostridium sp. PL3]|uniref:5-bromo-4-chloroindolyl phosphate hydrolysis family protein n=1 Tax=Clostridium thailandense TaxID=2794346 RepID=A0A949U1C3_9CLOT|nr:5-bromo-4-chloroindolyl phosphate hydrolysis family protein [Clostridium thailandense]MBV7275611.1 5-bromo-4-chloroindolyl phosphate hydrolysis family protein [Clostridium thailandense]
MRRKDFFDFEDQIRDTLKTTFEAIDFARLKNDIDDRTENALNEVKAKLKNKSQYLNEKVKNKKYYNPGKLENMIPKYINKTQKYIAKRPVGSVSGMLYTIFGFIGSSILGAMLIAYSIFTSFLSILSTANFITLGLLFSFFMASIALTLRGLNLRKRVKRFKGYVNTINGLNYCSIEELATTARKNNKFVVKDLRKMIDLGMFPQAHIDDKQTYFMLNDEVYENYLDSQESLKRRNEAELKRQEELNDPEKRELRAVIELGEDYIEQIKIANAVINKEEISIKLCRLQNVVSQIFNHLENNPKKLSEVNKFTNHYLPITLKLVNSYKELNEQPVQGDNIKNAKNEIERSIDMINAAFEKLLDDLFGEVALDISTDISVLETLFTQEGLTKEDFKK